MATFYPPFATPTVSRRSTLEHGDPTATLVVLLHGRGSHEGDIIGLADRLPSGLDYAAVRAPISEGGGFAWFANRGIGRPIAESLAETMAWFRSWLDGAAGERTVLLVGFSGGAAFAGGLLLADPARYGGAAILNGTLPFDAGVPTTKGRLADVPVFLSHGLHDTVIPAELQARTWGFLTGESGADVVARHEPAGHELTVEGVAALGAWLEEHA